MTTLTHLSPDAPLDAFVSTLEKDAALIIDDFLAPALLAQLHAELYKLLAPARHGMDEFTGYKTRRIGALIARAPAMREIAVNPLLLKLADCALRDASTGFQLHLTQAVSIGGGETEQILHRDRGLWGGYIPRRIETQLGTMLAITDFTKQNGATRVVPGSHRWDKNRTPKPNEIISAEMKAGSILIYTGTVLHGGGANKTKNTRTGVLMHYTLNWLRQQENQYLSCPIEVARTLSPQLRALIGYSQNGPVMGFYSSPTGESGQDLVPPETIFGDEISNLSKRPSAKDVIRSHADKPAKN